MLSGSLVSLLLAPGSVGGNPQTACDGSAMTKADLRRFFDELPDDPLDSAALLLRRATDPMIRVLDAAPLDDEPFIDEERDAVKRAREALDRGAGIALGELCPAGEPPSLSVAEPEKVV